MRRYVRKPSGILNDELYLKLMILFAGILYWVYGFMPLMDKLFNVLALLALFFLARILLSSRVMTGSIAVMIFIVGSGMCTIALNSFSTVSLIALCYMLISAGFLTYCSGRKSSEDLTDNLWKIARIILLGGTAVLAVSFLLYRAGVTVDYSYSAITGTTLHLGRSRDTNALVGILGNANITSDFCVIYIAMVLFAWRRNRHRKALCLLMLLLGFLVLFFTYSRGGYLGALVVLFVFILTDYIGRLKHDGARVWLYLGFLAEVLLAIAIVYFLLFRDPSSSLSDSLSHFTGRTSREMSGSTDTRLQLWSTGLKVLTDNPVNFLFGVGATIRTHIAVYAPVTLKESLFNNVHNIYIQTAVAYGVIGLLLMLTAIMVLLIKPARRMFRDLDRYQDLAPVLGLICGILVINLFESDFYMKKPFESSCFWIMLGLFSGLVRKREEESAWPEAQK